MKIIKKGILLCGIACFLFIGLGLASTLPVQATTPRDTTSLDNSLKSLTLSKGTLSPEFKPNVVKYTATVGAATNSVTVDAKLSNKNGKILSIVGGDNLKDGENTIKITVEAGSGALAVYNIVITRSTQQSTPPVKEPEIPVPDKTDEDSKITEEYGPTFEFETLNYRVVNNHEAIDLPEGFVGKSLEIQEIICAVYVYQESDTYLVYMENTLDNTDARYYVFDEQKSTPIFQLSYDAQKDLDDGLDEHDNSAQFEKLQEDYDVLYGKYKEDGDKARFLFYMALIVIVVLFILLVNVIIFERMRRRGREEDEENYLTACAHNSETNEKYKDTKTDKAEKVDKAVKVDKADVIKKPASEISNIDEIEYIDFDDL